MTISHWARAHSFNTADLSTDIIIVGGGYAGLATAYWISEYRPDLKVTILERGMCGAGASGRNAGFLTKGSASFYQGLSEKWGVHKARETYDFASQSLQLVHQHILQSSPEIKFEPASSSTLFQTEKSWKNWQKKDFDPMVFDFHWKDEAELGKSLHSKFFGAYENDLEYKVNPIQLLESLKRILVLRKIQIVENVSAFKITDDGVETDSLCIKGKQVVLALNGYFHQFHSHFKNYITPQRAQMLAVKLEDELSCPALYYDPPERVYWRKTQQKILIIGGKRLLDEEGEKGDFEKISPLIQQGLEAYLSEQLKVKFQVTQRWSGIMGFTQDELPIVTKIEAPVETFIIGGFSGHGMGLGFRSAMEMAELVTGLKKKSFFDSFKTIKIRI